MARVYKFAVALSVLSNVLSSESKLTSPGDCLWLGRAEVAAGQDSADCVSTCHEFCNGHIPGEYFCTGRHVYTDNDEFVYDSNEPNKRYSYCFCTRSQPTRLPGSWCGLGVETCNSSPTYVDGEDNMMEGVQGDLAVNITREFEIIDDDVSEPCQNDLYSKLRYMFTALPV